MEIRSVRHIGLTRLIERSDSRGLRQDLVKRIRRIVAMLVLASDMSEVVAPPGWRIHRLVGDRAGQ